jgi:hypothetical protein
MRWRPKGAKWNERIVNEHGSPKGDEYRLLKNN